MQNSNKQSVSGQELDNLLKQAFLNLDVTNPKHIDLMETVADHTLHTTVPVAGTTSSFFSLKWIIAFVSIGSIAITIALYVFVFSSEDKVNHAVYSFDEAIAPGHQKTALPLMEDTVKQLEEATNDLKPHIKKTEAEESTMSAPLPSQPTAKPYVAFMAAETTKAKDTAYVFPVLTDEEERANEKRKEKMLMQVIKLSGTKYAFIPLAYVKSDYFYSKGPFRAQYMQTTEVSNIEYKTFLFDLLIRNDKAGFLKAKPNQVLWNTIHDKKLGKYFEDMYFSDQAYNNYPVVNVSREGAELYCKWLQKESEQLAEEKDILKEDGRDRLYDRSYTLPTAKDWAYAAEGGKIGNDYPWDGKFMRNARGAYLANFCIQKDTVGVSAAGSHYTSAGIGLGAGQEAFICRVDGFKPNGFGLYNMSGNAAEFALDDSTGQLLTKGGSWNSSPEALKIGSGETHTGNGASPYHGFRPVINVKLFATAFSYREIDSSLSYRDTAPAFSNFEYKPLVVSPLITNPLTDATKGGDTVFLLPHFSKKEIKVGRDMKVKLMTALSSFSPDKYVLVPMGTCYYQSQAVSSQAFYMQTTEVSNAEYKAFLIDLYLKGDREEFRKCMPAQKQWTDKFQSGFNEAMQYLYFSHAAYDNYPVVNVSRYGAEAYCKWLTLETNKQLTAQGKALVNDVRIPSDVEWALAASNKKHRSKYANGTDSLKNIKGKYLQNYNGRLFASTTRDTVRDMYTFTKKTEGNFYTADARSYEPNLYGIYNLAGNVSEMVYLWDAATNQAKGFGTKGGSWFSSDYFLEIDAKQEFMYPERASPFTGFRTVVTVIVK
jgi:formylglycine-generating enzyme required for sulfatase activity